MHNIYAGGITRKDYTTMSQGKIRHILFHEQAVCRRGTKWKLLFPGGVRDNVSTVITTEAEIGRE